MPNQREIANNPGASSARGDRGAKPTDTNCLFFAKGKCKNGSACRFVHDRTGQTAKKGQDTASNLKATPKRTATSGPRVNPASPIGTLSSDHEPDRSQGKKPCFAWSKSGTCLKGQQCQYYHDFQVGNNARVSACQNSAATISTFEGSSSQHVTPQSRNHTLSKKPCFAWRNTGKCLRTDCKFEHDPELRDISRSRREATTAAQVHSEESHTRAITDERRRVLSETAHNDPCFAWNSLGTCPRGEGCPHEHDKQVREAILRDELVEALVRDEAAGVQREIEERRSILRATARAADKARVVEQLQATEIAQQEALRTFREAEAQWAREVAEATARREDVARKEAARRARIAQQEEARRAQEAARKAREAQEEAARQARVAQLEEARRAREAQQEARRMEIAKDEAAVTIQHIVLDFTVVTFSAGLEIQDILTGFESCRIRIRNLPIDAKHNEVCALFTQQGIKAGQFHIVEMKRSFDGRQEADVIGHEDLKPMVIALDGIDFRQEQLLFEISHHGGGEGMRSSTEGNSDILTISWRAPTVAFVVMYANANQAQAKIRELDRRVCAGRRVKVEMNRQPAGRGFRRDVPLHEIVIRGLDPSISDEEVSRFSGSALLRRLNTSNYDTAQVFDNIREHVEAAAPGEVERFEEVSANTVAGTFAIRVHFNDWNRAKDVHHHFENKRFPFIGNSSFWLHLRDALQYTILIPTQQYRAQKKMWDSLLASSRNAQGHKLWITPGNLVHTVHVAGEDKKTVGSLKVRVENLAAGEKLEGWHSSVGQRFLDSVTADTAAFLRIDRRNRALKVYGEPVAIAAARTMVNAEINRLESLQQMVFLKRQSVGFFMRRGLAALKEELGDGNVSLEISPATSKITIKGGEAARHTLNRLIEESLHNSNIVRRPNQEAQCPICYDDISSPVQLGCGHTYCTGCLRHFLTSASTFPLACMGNENQCGTPIPIPMIQRFLLPQQVTNLLENAFVTHIEHLPQDFKYCTTPDCRQVYRCDRSATATVALHCPSCLSAVCSSCHEEEHAGMTCAERKAYRDPAEQERLNEELAMQSGFKKCPQCKVWIEKTEGCNHMACKCGAHICWVCMGIFARQDIYPHMTATHGGINEAGAPAVDPAVHEHAAFDGEDIHMQRELLRMAGLRRADQVRGAQQVPPPRNIHVVQREMEARRLYWQGLQRDNAQILQTARQQEQAQDNGWGCVVM